MCSLAWTATQIYCLHQIDLPGIDLDYVSGTEYRQYLRQDGDDTHVNLGTLTDLLRHLSIGGWSQCRLGGGTSVVV